MKLKYRSRFFLPRNHTGLHKGDTARTSVTPTQRSVAQRRRARQSFGGRACGALKAVAVQTTAILRDGSDGRAYRYLLAAAGLPATGGAATAGGWRPSGTTYYYM